MPGGAQVSAAGVTAVGVQPTHRRRGINAALMRAQLDDVHARGEPIAVLYASEGGIYGRFGYGLSSFLGEIDFEGGRSTFIRGYRRWATSGSCPGARHCRRCARSTIARSRDDRA